MGGPPQCHSREKVFCKECKYLANVSGNTTYPVVYKCEAPNNRSKDLDTWYMRGVGQNKLPRKINKKNNCPWFTAKGSGGKKLL